MVATITKGATAMQPVQSVRKRDLPPERDFPIEAVKAYLEENSAWRSDTRLDPQATYAARGVRTVSGRILTGAEAAAAVRAVYAGLLMQPNPHNTHAGHVVVWFGCEVGYKRILDRRGTPLFVLAHPMTEAVMTEGEVMRHYGMAAGTVNSRLSEAWKAVLIEWVATRGYRERRRDGEPEG